MSITISSTSQKLLIKNVQSFGAYFYKPTDIQALQNISKIYQDLKFEAGTRIYAVGFPTYKYVLKSINKVVYRSLDYVPTSNDESFEGLASLIQFYVTPDYSDSKVVTVESSTIAEINNLIKFVKVSGYVPKGKDLESVKTTLDTVQGVVVSADDASVATKESKPMSREDTLKVALDFMQCLKSCDVCSNIYGCILHKMPDSKELLSAMETLVKFYKSGLRQNKESKLVRMADGSRKWFSNDVALKMLALPRSQRV